MLDAFTKTWPVWEDRTGARELAGQIVALGEHAGSDLDCPQAASVLALRVRGLALLNELYDNPGLAIRLGVSLTADCQRVLGAEHPDTLASRSNLAYAYLSAGRLGEAIPLVEQALADTERVLGVTRRAERARMGRSASGGVGMTGGACGVVVAGVRVGTTEWERPARLKFAA